MYGPSRFIFKCTIFEPIPLYYLYAFSNYFKFCRYIFNYSFYIVIFNPHRELVNDRINTIVLLFVSKIRMILKILSFALEKEMWDFLTISMFLFITY